jgi:transcriptional regulator with XRE-family HTH domain
MGETSTTPTPRAYILGAELRHAREGAGLGLRELAKRLDVSHSVIVRWEKGERLPSTVNTSALLAILGVSSAERDRIIETVREAWDEPVNSVSVGVAGMADQLTALMEFERNATAITDVSPLLIPGLLQTSDYSRAIIGDSPDSEAKVAVRLGRRDVITRHRSPVQYQAMIAESVLYQPVGAEVLTDQLRLVHQLSDQDNVCIRVIPTSAGFTPAHAGPFVLLEFDKAEPVVHLEHHRSSAFLRDPGDVRAYLAARDDLERVAMSPEASGGLIADVINRNGA